MTDSPIGGAGGLRATARRVARYIQSQSGQAAPRLPAFDEILVLARDYLVEVGNGHDESNQRLGETGQIYVTLPAARAWGATPAIDDETARRQLTALLIDAKQISADPQRNQSRWRLRGRKLSVDLIVRVSHEEEPLLLVLECEVNQYAGGRRG